MTDKLKIILILITEETDKNFDFVTEILFRFLGFGDFKVSIVIENSLWFFLVVSLASMQIKSFLNPFSKIKLPT